MKWLTRAKEDVAAPEATEPRPLRSGHRERDDRRVRVLCDERDAGTAAKELPALAAMAFGEIPQRLPGGEHGQRHLQRAAVRLAPPDWKRADRAEDVPDHRHLEELALGHVADGATQCELHPRRVLPVDVVRDEDERSARRDVLRALEAPRAEKRGDRAHDRKAEAPEPEPLLRERRGFREHGHDGIGRRSITLRTRSNASRTDSPSVSTTIASSAARRGATVRLLSSSSRRRISASRSWRERFSPRAASSSSRRRARSAAEAVRKTFRSACGSTIVPMSRPTITIRPRSAIARCCSTITSRTYGTRATCETIRSTSGLRISQVTSAPSRRTV